MAEPKPVQADGRRIAVELEPVFYPQSIALIGISSDSVNVAQMYLLSLRDAGFPRVYPVNPRGGEIAGDRVYASVEDIPGDVDLAIVTVPRDSVVEVARRCARKRVKAMVLYTGGFGEMGPEGRKLQEEIVEIAWSGGTRVIGPNCLGPYNPAARLVTQLILPRESGSVGVISHSGFLFYYLLLSVAETGLLPSRGVSCGSDSDLTCVDFLEYLGEDPETKVIVAYLEGIRDGRLLQIGRDVSLRKPVIVLKGGDTEAGIKASASHTGTLAVPSVVWKSLCDQTGIVAVESFEQMMDTMRALHSLKPARGRRVGIIATPGGLAVTCADACSRAGLQVPQLAPETSARLAEIVEEVGTSVNNPADVGMVGALAPEHYLKEAIRIVGSDPGIDMLIVAFTGPPYDDDEKDRRTTEILFDQIAAVGKPTVICGAVPKGWPRGEFRFMTGASVPVYPDPRRAAQALAKLAGYSEFLRSAR